MSLHWVSVGPTDSTRLYRTTSRELRCGEIARLHSIDIGTRTIVREESLGSEDSSPPAIVETKEKSTDGSKEHATRARGRRAMKILEHCRP
jgi:hypothetical protein